MLGADICLTMCHRLAIGILKNALGAWSKGNVTSGNGISRTGGQFLNRSKGFIIGHVKLCKRLCCDTLALFYQCKKEVFGSNIQLVKSTRFLLSKAHNLTGFVCEFIEHCG